MDIEAIRAHLTAELEEIDRLDQVTAEGRQAIELDQTSLGRLSRVDAMQQQAMALEAQRRRYQRRERVEAALKRIEAGEFGDCVVCGEPIPQERLELDFATPTCVRCAA